VTPLRLLHHFGVTRRHLCAACGVVVDVDAVLNVAAAVVDVVAVVKEIWRCLETIHLFTRYNSL